MPIYEYKCNTCDEIIEEIQKFSDPPLEVCSCGGALERLIGTPSIHFKGECWANDGYSSSKRSDKSVIRESEKTLIESVD